MNKKTELIFEIIGTTVIIAAMCAVIITKNPDLCFLNIVGLIVLFCDRFYVFWHFVIGFLRGRTRLFGHEVIYQKQIDMLKDSGKGDNIYFSTPVTRFGIYSSGVRIYEKILGELRSAVDRGVNVKILCDVFDIKSVVGLVGLTHTGAEIWVRRESEPWDYFLIAPGRRKAIRSQTHDLFTGMNGSVYRPLYPVADFVSGKEVCPLVSQFEDELKQKGVLLSGPKISVLEKNLTEAWDGLQTFIKGSDNSL